MIPNLNFFFRKFNCFWGWCAVHSKAESFFCIFTLVGNQIVDKRWSFNLNRFYRMGVFALRERVFCIFIVGLGHFVRVWGYLYCNSVSRFFSASLLYIFCLFIKKKIIALIRKREKGSLCSFNLSCQWRKRMHVHSNGI